MPRADIISSDTSYLTSCILKLNAEQLPAAKHIVISMAKQWSDMIPSQHHKVQSIWPNLLVTNFYILNAVTWLRDVKRKQHSHSDSYSYSY